MNPSASNLITKPDPLASGGRQPPGSTAQPDRVLAKLIEDLAARLQAGEEIDLDAFAAAQGENAEALRQLIPTIELLADLGRSAASSGSLPAAPDEGASGTLGDFRILRQIGRGGMGIVYEAEQISLGRRVALKVLPFAGALDPRQLQRFKNEAQAAAHLHHTNIVPVFYVGCERGVHYYAMQLIEGCTLAEVIAELRTSTFDLRPSGQKPRGQDIDEVQVTPTASRHDPSLEVRAPSTEGRSSKIEDRDAKIEDRKSKVDSTVVAVTTDRSITNRAFFENVARLGIQAAEALEHAHQMGVVHRDIKPGNLLLDQAPVPTHHSTTHHSPHLWITDFGLAQFQTGTELTMTGDLVGTLRYMSPEQALAKRVVIDHRTDIYSLGVTLYELLTLRPAFNGKDRSELLRQIAFEEPKAAHRLNKSIPSELAIIIQKGMEKNPADRYATAQEMADDLRRFLQNEPIRAKRPSLMQRAGKWSRRHPAIVRSAAVILLFVTAGSLLSAGLIWREQQRTSDALEAEATARNQAEEAKEIAEMRVKETTAVLDFVENRIFAAARPEGDEGGLGRDVKLRDAIKSSMPFVEGSFKDQPLIEARLRHTLGVSFFELGDYSMAEGEFKTALDIRETKLGPDHPEALATMRSLTNTYRELGRLEEALRIANRTLELCKARLGPDHPDTLKSINTLVGCYQGVGRSKDAVRLLEEALPLVRTKFGLDDIFTLTCMSNLAICYLDSARAQDALKLNEETLELVSAKYGRNHAIALSCMDNLGDCYRSLGRYEQAVNVHEEALRLREAKFGLHHGRTLNLRTELAKDYWSLDRHADAFRLFEENLTLMRGSLGPVHRNTLNRAVELAIMYDQLGRDADALKLWEESLIVTKTKLGPDDHKTLLAMNNLAAFLSTARDPKYRNPGRAVSLAKELVEKQPRQGEYWNTLGMAQYRASELNSSIASLQKSMDLRQGGDSNDWFFLAMAHWRLGQKHLARKWYDKAVQWMDKNDPHDPNVAVLERFRAEAAELLGIKEKKTTATANKDGSSAKH